MENKFFWGIIGLGKIAQKFAQDLDYVEFANLSAVASTSLERAKKFSKTFDVPHTYTNYADLLACPNLDAVYIATPHTSHAELTMMCLKANIPVLCEKPFGMNRTQVQAMIHTAQVYDTFLMEAMWTRFLPTTQKLLQLIEADTIGDIRLVQADFGYYAPFDPESRIFNAELGGGSLLDVGIYPAFLSLLLLGAPTDIKAAAHIGKSNVDETCAAVLTHQNGAITTFHSSIVAKTPTIAIIYGERGHIKIHGRFHEPNDGLTIQLYNGQREQIEFDWPSRGYHYEALEVMRCVRAGLKQSPLLPLDFSLQLITLLDDIRHTAGIKYPFLAE